jgi:hypothetical protein
MPDPGVGEPDRSGHPIVAEGLVRLDRIGNLKAIVPLDWRHLDRFGVPRPPW